MKRRVQPETGTTGDEDCFPSGRQGSKVERGLAGSRKKPTVLIVDDEPASLALLMRTLRGGYQILRASTGLDGLYFLEKHPVAVVVSDQKMPGLTGVDFLAESADKWPHTQRILLTGYTEVEKVIDAINKGQVFGYLSKPWHPENLLSMLRKAAEVYQLLCLKERLLEDLKQKNRELEQLLLKTKDLQEASLQAERWAAIGKLSAMVAHDLKNPLAAIQCHTDLLREETFSENLLDRSTRSIQSQVRKMNQYIEDLLVFSKPGDTQSVSRSYAVPALIHYLQEAFAERCRQKGVTLETRIRYPGYCWVNPSRICRALSNIMDNALDAAGEGGVIRVITEEIDEKDVRIRVQDSGPGIPPELRQRLFEPFVSFNKPSGTGLGLAVVKKIVKEQGGRVWERQGDLGGACFHVTLPKPPSKAAYKNAVEESGKGGSL